MQCRSGVSFFGHLLFRVSCQAATGSAITWPMLVVPFCLERSVARFLSIFCSFSPDPHDSIDPICIMLLVTNSVKSPITLPHVSLPSIPIPELILFIFVFNSLLFPPFYLPWHEHEQCNIYSFHRQNKRERCGRSTRSQLWMPGYAIDVRYHHVTYIIETLEHLKHHSDSSYGAYGACLQGKETQDDPPLCNTTSCRWTLKWMRSWLAML